MTEKKTSSKASAGTEKAEKPSTSAAKSTAAEKAAETTDKKTAAEETKAAAKKSTTAAKKSTTAAKKTSTAAKKTTAAAKKSTTAAKKTTTAAKKSSTAAKKTTIAAKKSSTAAKKTTTAAKKTTTAAKKSSTAARKTTTAAKKSEAPKTAPEKAAKPAAAEKAPAAPATKAAPAKKINILFATPECVPFESSGGLGEVSGSLPKSLNKTGSIDCRVIMPLYAGIHRDYRNQMQYIGYKYVDVTWRHQYMGLFKLEMNGVTYYFIDNEYYFKREGLYGYYDDCERFAFFSKAVFTAMELMDDFHPDIIHANDWQTALIPVYQNSYFRIPYLKTVFTVHNIEYQGHYGKEVQAS
ncbi:MAG: glycogen synthase, partial [Anaerovoracaceae bacterium]